jgi:hypothetical protein
LLPLRAGRAIASVGQQINFRTGLVLHGQKVYEPPHRLRLEVDDRAARELTAPMPAPLANGQIPFSFSQRFTKAGTHHVSLIVEPDPPSAERPAGYEVKDRLPGDNRKDLSIEVLPVLPVLLVDGDESSAPRNRTTDFLRDALAPANDPAPVVRVKVVSIRDFDLTLLTTSLGPEPDVKPRVVVLADVARLRSSQQEAITQFVGEGGGLLVTLGERVDPRHYNDQLFQAGEGWLPAHLQEIAGDVARPEQSVSPLPASFLHPVLELFRDAGTGGLADAHFPRWHRVSTPRRPGTATAIALFTNHDPWLVERSFRLGRVILSTVPLDNSWRSNLPELPAFAPLIHELIYDLAGARSTDTYFVSDSRESDLTSCTQADRENVSRYLPMTYENDCESLLKTFPTTEPRFDLWPWFLLGVIVLLCSEVWMTRRIAKTR